MIFSNTGLTSDSLIFNFDLSNNKSYNGNSGFTTTSLTFYNYYTLKDFIITGYGHTTYDFGLSTSFTDEKHYTLSDRNLIFQRIGKNDASGNTFGYVTGLTTGATSGDSAYTLIYNNPTASTGNYFTLSGGYLTSYFKLYEYPFQLAPFRFENGYTIDTWLNISDDSFNKITSYTEGIFVYFGTKSENKYNAFYSSLTYGNNVESAMTIIISGLPNSSLTKTFSSYTFDTLYDPVIDTEYNAFCLKLNEDRTLSLRYLGKSGQTIEYKGDKIIPTGWTNVVLSFQYCEKIRDNDDKPYENDSLNCFHLRDGNLRLFINGEIYLEKLEIEEFFWLTPLNTIKERQIGLPYSISWGGGSPGLKNAYNVSAFTATISSVTGNNYTITGSNLIIDGDSGSFENNITGITTSVLNSVLTSDTAVFYTGASSLKLTTLDILSAYTATTNNLFEFSSPILFEPDKKYIFQGYLYDFSSFTSVENQNVYFIISTSFTQYDVISSITYNSANTINQWNELYYEINTTTGFSGTVSANLIITSQTQYSGFNNNYSFNIDNINCYKYDRTDIIGYTGYSDEKLINPNYYSIIKDNFDGGFYGDIQQLRLYSRSFKFDEVKKNYNYFSTRYSFKKKK